MEQGRINRSLRTPGLILLFVVAAALMAYFARDRAFLYGFVPTCFVSGVLLLALWKWGRLTMAQVLTGAVLLRILFIWLPPGLSDDAYRYVWDGYVQIEGLNPYLYTPQELPAIEPSLFGRLNSSGFYSIYPPVSQLVFLIGGLAGGDNWLVSYYIIKLLLSAVEMGGVFLLARMAPPQHVLLYAWNPLVLVETAGQAHTEALAVLFLVLTVFLAERQRGRWASAALALAGWVKLYPFVLFPFLWRRFGWKAVWPAVLVSAAVWAPYFDLRVPQNIAASLDLYVRYFEFNAGFYYGIKQVYLTFTGVDVSKTLGPFLRGVFLAALPVLYTVDYLKKWPLRQAFVWTIAAFLVLATTVHPWYFLGLLALTVPAAHPSWDWLWVGLLSMGTYLLYVEGPYWPFVWIGWTGWLALAAFRYYQQGLDWIQRRRAEGKLRRIQPYLPEAAGSPLKVLDLGGAEGYVGKAMQQRLGVEVALCDVLDLNRTDLPLTLYDGRCLPFRTGAFDVTVLYFVLHHCEDPAQVLCEAIRVTRGRVLIVESVYRSWTGQRWLQLADRLANRIRSGGRMSGQEEHLRFRRVDEWDLLIKETGGEVVERKEWGTALHRQVLFAVKI